MILVNHFPTPPPKKSLLSIAWLTKSHQPAILVSQALSNLAIQPTIAIRAAKR